MKKQSLIKSLLILAIYFSALSCSKQDPVEYNNTMMTIINDSQTDMNLMNAAMMSQNYEKAEEVRANWEKNIEKSIKEVEKIGDFNGDSAFKDAVLKSMNDYKKVVSGEYKTLIGIRKSGDVSKQAEEEKTLDKINTTLENAANSLNIASSAFEAEVNK